MSAVPLEPEVCCNAWQSVRFNGYKTRKTRQMIPPGVPEMHHALGLFICRQISQARRFGSSAVCRKQP